MKTVHTFTHSEIKDIIRNDNSRIGEDETIEIDSEDISSFSAGMIIGCILSAVLVFLSQVI